MRRHSLVCAAVSKIVLTCCSLKHLYGAFSSNLNQKIDQISNIKISKSPWCWWSVGLLNFLIWPPIKRVWTPLISNFYPYASKCLVVIQIYSPLLSAPCPTYAPCVYPPIFAPPPPAPLCVTPLAPPSCSVR